MNSFAPLAVRVLGSRHISRNRRVQLNYSLVLSKLVFNVHVWSSFHGKPRNIINQMYMRSWRRVAGDPRYGKTVFSDYEIRVLLGVPSIDCYVRKRRLLYMSRLAAANFDALHAALQAKGTNGSKMPWINTLADDLCILRKFVPHLAELPDPHTNFDPYWQITKNYRNEWRQLI